MGKNMRAGTGPSVKKLGMRQGAHMRERVAHDPTGIRKRPAGANDEGRHARAGSESLAVVSRGPTSAPLITTSVALSA